MPYALTRLSPIEGGPPPRRPPTPAAVVQHPPREPVSKLWQRVTQYAQVRDDVIAMPIAGDAAVRIPTLPLPPDAPAPVGMVAVVDALEAVNQLAREVSRLRDDQTLSVIGRQEQVDGHAAAAIVAISAAASRLAAHEKELDRQEAELTDPLPAPTDAAGIARAAEVRAAVQSMTPPEAMALVSRLIDAGRGAEVVSALVHGPLPPQAELEEHVKATWKAHRLAENPQVAEALETQRRAAGWARLALAQLGATARQLASTFGSYDVLDRLLKARPSADAAAAWPFGYSPQEVATARVRLGAAAARGH